MHIERCLKVRQIYEPIHWWFVYFSTQLRLNIRYFRMKLHYIWKTKIKMNCCTMRQSCGNVVCQRLQRYRIVITLLLVTLSTALMLRKNLLSPDQVPPVFRTRLARSNAPNWLNGFDSLKAKPTGLLVDTPSCQIPDFDAYNPSISPYIRNPDPQFIVCSHSLPITVTDGQYIRLNTRLAQSLRIHLCLYQEVR